MSVNFDCLFLIVFSLASCTVWNLLWFFLACNPLINFVGDSWVDTVDIVWTSPHATSWVRHSIRTSQGELALEVIVQKGSARQNGDAWRTVVDACLTVMHLIDTTRSIPYGSQPIKECFDISFAFDQSVQVILTSYVIYLRQSIINRQK